MANPRIEEVDDASDPDEMDLDAFDFARPQQGTLQAEGEEDDDEEEEEDEEDHTSRSRISANEFQRLLSPETGTVPQLQRPILSEQDRERAQQEQYERTRSFQCIYPVYFDATRSREQGRRVRKADAVSNPLAREIVDALQHIGKSTGTPLQIAFEPVRTHPKDWANPGRVRVLVKKDGRPISSKLANKHHLYKLIADYLRTHPSTKDSPLKLRIQGLPPPKDGKVPAPSVPRGFKIGSILPLHSPALSGGGVSDTFLQDMMQQMGGQMPPGMAPQSESGGQKKVKDKRKK